MFPASRITASRRRSLVLVAFVLASLLQVPRFIQAEPSSFDTASLRGRDGKISLPRVRRAAAPLVPPVTSKNQALRSLGRVESDLTRRGNATGSFAELEARLEPIEQFLQAKHRETADSTRYQWHRAGEARPEPGTNGVILRPKSGIPAISALDLQVQGQSLEVEFVRAYGASGLVFEYRPRRIVGLKQSGRELRLRLDREIVLTAVEVFFRPGGPAPSDFILQGGIAVEAPSAMNALYSLKLAKRNLQQQRYELAAFRIRESIAFVKTIR